MLNRSACWDESKLAAYLDGRLGSQELQDAEAHLACCPECLSKVMEAREFMTVTLEQPPAYVLQQVKAMVSDPEKGTDHAWEWLRYIFRPEVRWAPAVIVLGFLFASLAGAQLAGAICDGIGIAVEIGGVEGNGLI